MVAGDTLPNTLMKVLACGRGGNRGGVRDRSTVVKTLMFCLRAGGGVTRGGVRG